MTFERQNPRSLLTRGHLPPDRYQTRTLLILRLTPQPLAQEKEMKMKKCCLKAIFFLSRKRPLGRALHETKLIVEEKNLLGIFFRSNRDKKKFGTEVPPTFFRFFFSFFGNRVSETTF